MKAMNYPIRNYAQIDKDMRSFRVWDRGAWLSPHTREQRFRRDIVLPTVKELKSTTEAAKV